MYRLASPAHPGKIIRLEIIEELGLKVSEAAEALGVTRPALSALLNCRASLSPEMALRLEKAFGLDMDTLLRVQVSFDTAKIRARSKEIKVKKYTPVRQSGRSAAVA